MRLQQILDNSNHPNQDEFLVEIDRWLMSLVRQNLSRNTQLAYRAVLCRFAQFVQEDVALLGDWRACNKGALERFLFDRLERDGIKAVSAKQALSAIRRFYRFAMHHGLCASDPTAGYHLKTPPRPLPAIKDVDLLSQLLDRPIPQDINKAALWIRDKAMFELLYSSGLRVSELVGVDVQDVDITAKNVRVLGKGDKIRIVPVGKKALEALNAYLPYRQVWQKNTQALFVSQSRGTRLTTRVVQLRLKACALEAGIGDDLYPHLLRHCFASHLLSASGDLRAVQEMLGHSNLSTTQIYTQVDFVALTNVYDKAHPRAEYTTLPKDK